MIITVLSNHATQNIVAQDGQSLLDAIRAANGLSIHAPCGGQGTCKKCTVYLVTEQGEQPLLACQTRAEDKMTIRLPSASPLEVTLEGKSSSLFAPDAEQDGYGIACDIGTTTVVCHLVDLASGEVLATAGQGNAQRPYGGDVIARIKAASDGMLGALTSAITSQLSQMISDLCRQNHVSADQLKYMAVAANTTMCHLLTGLDPSGIGKAPFIPRSYFGDSHAAKELGLPFSGDVYIVPAVSGYVGGDITADILAAKMDQADRPILLIDIGTNGEMALGCGDHFVCCSTAAGPAFEGAQISCGMTAAAGAISSVEWVNGALKCATIGDCEAIGLCGSGLIDAMAVMLELGAVDETGRMLDVEEDEDDIPDEIRPYLFLTEDEEPAFRLSEQVYVTQGDVRKLQLGKGAISAGVRVLMQEHGIPFSDIGALLLAGGFGSFVRPESAARIGLIPWELLPVTSAIGNAAADGARAALISQTARDNLAALKENMHYLELSGLAAFNEAYMDAMMFPEGE